jgi:hypothetical protein
MSKGTKYPWQQLLLDAFTASSEALRSKIDIAERAIAARLRDQPQPDADERQALTDALNALCVLIAEINPKSARPEENKKKDIA